MSSDKNVFPRLVVNVVRLKLYVEEAILWLGIKWLDCISSKLQHKSYIRSLVNGLDTLFLKELVTEA